MSGRLGGRVLQQERVLRRSNASAGFAHIRRRLEEYADGAVV